MSEDAEIPRLALPDTQPLPWQLQHWQRLETALKNQRFAHAWLLAGETGVGKRLFAAQLVQRLMCAENSDSSLSLACGHCRSCTLLKAQSHPDLMVVEAEAKGKAIRVDQVRMLNEFVTKTAQISARQLIVIFEADSLNRNASNALLKLLEEPPAGSYFLLHSHSPNRLVATIRSRCQQLGFGLPKSELAVPWLAAQLSCSAEDASEKLRWVRGAPLAALAEQSLSPAESAALLAQLAGLVTAPASLPGLVREWNSWKLDELFLELQRLLLEVLRDAACATERGAGAELVAAIGAAGVLELNEQLQLLREKQLRGHNLKLALALESVLLRLHAMAHS